MSAGRLLGTVLTVVVAIAIAWFVVDVALRVAWFVGKLAIVLVVAALVFAGLQLLFARRGD